MLKTITFVWSAIALVTVYKHDNNCYVKKKSCKNVNRVRDVTQDSF